MSVPAGKEDEVLLFLSLYPTVAVTMRSIDPAECFRVRRKPLSLRRRSTKKEVKGVGY